MFYRQAHKKLHNGKTAYILSSGTGYHKRIKMTQGGNYIILWLKMYLTHILKHIFFYIFKTNLFQSTRNKLSKNAHLIYIRIIYFFSVVLSIGFVINVIFASWVFILCSCCSFSWSLTSFMTFFLYPCAYFPKTLLCFLRSRQFFLSFFLNHFFFFRLPLVDCKR